MCINTIHPSFTLLVYTVHLTSITSPTGWVESGSGILSQVNTLVRTQAHYRVYKMTGSYNPSTPFSPLHLCAGDIVVSLQGNTIHWVDNGGVFHLWEGNNGKNQSWEKAVLWWDGKTLRWTPASTKTRLGKTELGSLGVKAIVAAIASPSPLQIQAKRRSPNQTLSTGRPLKLQKPVHPSSPNPADMSLLEYSPEPIDTAILDPSLGSMDNPLPKYPHHNPHLPPTFCHTHDKIWTSQPCLLDTVGEYPEGNLIQAWKFSQLKTISPIHATVGVY